MIVGGGVLPAVRADLDASVPPDESLFRRNRIVVSVLFAVTGKFTKFGSLVFRYY
jgi:hypothetical protein